MLQKMQQRDNTPKQRVKIEYAGTTAGTALYIFNTQDTKEDPRLNLEHGTQHYPADDYATGGLLDSRKQEQAESTGDWHREVVRLVNMVLPALDDCAQAEDNTERNILFYQIGPPVRQIVRSATDASENFRAFVATLFVAYVSLKEQDKDDDQIAALRQMMECLRNKSILTTDLDECNDKLRNAGINLGFSD